MKKLNDCHGIFQFPIENDPSEFDTKPKSRFALVQRYKNAKIKHRDDKELLKSLHSIPIDEWRHNEVANWLECLKLSEYQAAFKKHDIHGPELINIGRRDLRV